MNSSLLLVAVHFLPEISRAVAHAQGSETARQVTRVVCAVAGTRNPFLALRRIEADMGRAAALRIRLASIACDREIALAESRHRARKGQADTRRSFPGRAHAVGLALTLGAGFLSIFALGLGRSQAALAAPRRDEVRHMLFGDAEETSWFATHPPILERIRALEPGFKAEDLDAYVKQWVASGGDP